MQKSRESGNKLEGVQKTMEANNKIAGAVKAETDEIRGASEEQARGVAQISAAIGQMNQVTQSTAAQAEESASACPRATMPCRTEGWRDLCGPSYSPYVFHRHGILKSTGLCIRTAGNERSRKQICQAAARMICAQPSPRERMPRVHAI